MQSIPGDQSALRAPTPVPPRDFGASARAAPKRGTGAGAAPWHIVRTGARRERILARELETAGIEYVLPLSRVQRTYAGRVCEVQVPLLDRCVFARAGEADLRSADASGSIRRVFPLPDQQNVDRQLRQFAPRQQAPSRTTEAVEASTKALRELVCELERLEQSFGAAQA